LLQAIPEAQESSLYCENHPFHHAHEMPILDPEEISSISENKATSAYKDVVPHDLPSQ
jgi:hypothetical protein